MKTRHVIVLTYGEPPTPNYLDQLRYSWRILLGLTRTVAPIPRPVLPVIALSRARFRRRLWTRERYRSPLEPITHAQAEQLRRTLGGRADRTRWQVHVAYEFRDPSLRVVLDALPLNERVDIVPMYVADSAFTHGISRQTLWDWERRRGGREAEARVVPPLEEDRFAAISAAFVDRQLDLRGIGGPEWALLLAAHGTLLEAPSGVETGREATERVCAGVARRLAGRFGMVANGWLNHSFGGRWTQPPVDEALRRVAEAGYRRVAYFPYGFSADNAETELEGRIALRTQPELDSIHLPCLNDDAALIREIADRLIVTD